MTVSTDISSARYEGNGVTDTFSFNGRIFTNSDLSIDIITRSTDVVVETLAPSDYTVSLVSSEGAEIIVSGPKIPSASQDILIYRNIDINQSLRLPTGTVFPASDVESALDRLTILIQDTQDDGSRSLIFPKNISGIVTPYLPSPEDGKLLVWDGDAGNVANLSVTNLVDEGFDTVFTSLVATDFLQYDGVSWVNIHNSDFPLQSIKAPTSGGLVLKNNSGTTILTIGPGGASSATFAGTLNIPDGTVSTYAKIASGVFASSANIIAGTASKLVDAANFKSGLRGLESYTLLSSQTASSSSQLVFTSLITSEFDEYVFEFIDIVPVTSGAILYSQFSSDNGATWLSTANYSRAGTLSQTSSASVFAINQTGQQQMGLSGSLNTSERYACNGSAKLFNPLSTQKSQRLSFQMSYANTTPVYEDLHGTIYYDPTTLVACTAIRFYMSSGNIASGTVRMYGIRKT